MSQPVSVTIRFIHDDDAPSEVSINSSDPKEIAVFMADALRDWIVDEAVEITIDGKIH